MKKNYVDYNAIAFAEDATFIKWVRHQDPKAKRFWENWIQTHPDKAPAIQEAKILVQALQVKEEEPSKERIDKLWAKIDLATSEKSAVPTPQLTSRKPQLATRNPQPSTSKVRSLRPMRWLSYAAAACIAGLLFFYLQDPTTIVQIGKGEHLAYTLPDASTVQLNADSKISFEQKAWSKERVCLLYTSPSPRDATLSRMPSSA